MSDKLIIGSVNAENFGGLTQRQLDIPDESMVVIHGRNEVGKSTFSELITWLLVGPSTDSKVIRMLGKSDEHLIGELSGRLKGRSFVARGDFKITPKSWDISAKSERVYEMDGLLTPEQWLHGLRDIDRAAMEGIYRLWGQQLHDGGDADTEMRRAGLGAIAMSADPRATIDQLAKLSKPEAKLGEGDTSFKSISTELKEVRQAFALANNNVVEYNSKVAELAGLESQVAELREQGLILSRRRANLVSFQNLDELRVTESAAQAAVREQPAAPEAWLPAVEQIHRLRSVIEKCEQQRRSANDARRDFAGQVSAAGLDSSTTPAEVVEKFVITTHDAGTVGGAVRDVGYAEGAHRQAVEARDAIQREMAAAETAADQAASELGADLDRVRTAHLDPESRASAITMISRFSDAQLAVSAAQSDLTLAEASVAGATESVRLAELRWQQVGVDMPAREWRGRGGSRNASSVGPFTVRKLFPVLALAVAALVAAALTQWVLVVLIVLAAIVVWVASPAAVEMGNDPLVGEAADQIIGAEATLDAERVALVRAEQTVAGREEQLAKALESVGSVGPRLGVDLPDDPLAVADVLSRWGEAADLVARFDKICVDLQAAVGQCDATAETQRMQLAELDSKLTGFGLPAGTDPATAQDVANRYAELVGQAKSLIEGQAIAAEAEAQLTEVLGPVAEEVSEWMLADIGSKAEEAAEIQKAHTGAVDDAKSASDRIADLVGDNRDLAALIDSGVDLATVKAEIDDIDIKATDLDQQQQSFAEQTGVVKEEIKRLASEQQIADLRLTQGSLEEIRDEIGFEMASHRLAALVLQHVADEYERKNQPELIRRTGALALTVAEQWSGVEVRLAGAGADATSLIVNLVDGSAVPAIALSTGARALLYLSLRVAMAEHDTEVRGVALPLICDDPLVHLDDDRAAAALRLLADASKSRQVVMFTCHDRTTELAESIGVTTHRI